MKSPAWKPFCAAVDALVRWEEKCPERDEAWEQVAARADALGQLKAVLEDGEEDPLPLSELLRLRGLPDTEAMALAMCRGSVLDVGAGSGVHSLLLQDQGVDVTAMDAQPELVELMRTRGVEQVCCADILELDQSANAMTWDTLLFMMNGLGLCGDLDGLRRLLVRCHTMVADGGAVLADGCDLRLSPAPEEADRIRLRLDAGREFCEAQLQMTFESRSGGSGEERQGERLVGAPFAWLYVDYATLEQVADEAGWSCQCVFSGGAEYLARLSW